MDGVRDGSLPQPLVEGLEAFRAVAYRQGWEDAMTAVFDAAAEKVGAVPQPKLAATTALVATPEPSAEDIAAATDAGRKDFAAMSRADNPYARGSAEAKAWDDGWVEAEKGFVG